MDILEKALIISLFCVGLRIISSEGMILYFIRKPYEKGSKLTKAILKPIIGCVTCMSGIYTIIIELSYYSISKWTILTIFIVAAFNSIIYALYELISTMIKHYTNLFNRL